MRNCPVQGKLVLLVEEEARPTLTTEESKPMEKVV